MKLVKSAKFPPAGNRGFGSPFSMEKFGGPSQTEYLQQANDALVTIVQIETKEALEEVGSFHRTKTTDETKLKEQVDAIAKVPGIDCLFVGVSCS